MHFSHGIRLFVVAVVTAFALPAHAGEAASHSAAASAHAGQSAAHLALGGAKLASGVAAIPFLAGEQLSGVGAAISGDIGGALRQAAESPYRAPLPVSDLAITAAPAPAPDQAMGR